MAASPLLRVDIEATQENRLTRRSQIMVDKLLTPLRGKIGAAIGYLDDATMVSVNRAMGVFPGFA
jgi:mRNA interferase MazF